MKKLLCFFLAFISLDGFVQERVLAFSKTAGYRHSNIDDAVYAITNIGNSSGFTVTSTENAGYFRSDSLAKFKAVVFNNTTGDILNEQQQSAFQNYIEGGGGFVGIHSASDTEYGWPWYGKLVGAWFNGHPDIQDATLNKVSAHPSTDGLPDRWIRTDEWYNFGAFQSPVNVLYTVDESTYSGGTMGKPHPIAWYHTVGSGRSWYTGMGHQDQHYHNANFIAHLAGGIKYALGRFSAPPPPPPKEDTVYVPVPFPVYVYQRPAADSIHKAGDIAVVEKVRSITLDSNMRSVKLMNPLPKLVNNFIYQKKYRIKLYSNGVYTKELIK